MKKITVFMILLLVFVPVVSADPVSDYFRGLFGITGKVTSEKPIILYRTVRYCSDGAAVGPEQVIDLKTGKYTNYKCESRYKEQCDPKNPSDTYYDEKCKYETSTGIDVPVILKEQVKCIFANSNAEQKCYTDDGKFGCSGVATCVADVSGEKDKKLTWKSSCGAYAYTIIDGSNKYAEFKCGVVGGETTSAGGTTTATCTDSDGGKDYYMKGTTSNQFATQTDTCVTGFALERYGYDLYEYYCSGPNPNYDGSYDVIPEGYKCPNGCKDGACVKETTSSIKIIYFEGPQVLNADEMGTFTWKAENANGGQLMWDIAWGDTSSSGTSKEIGQPCGQNCWSVNTTAGFMYQGNYKITARVYDYNGNEVKDVRYITIIKPTKPNTPLPPSVIAVHDNGPASDIILASKIIVSLQSMKNEDGSLKYGNIPSSYARLFSEIDLDSLDNQVTLLIYNGEAVIIVGSHSPTSQVVFAKEITKILERLNIINRVMSSSDVIASNLVDLFASNHYFFNVGGSIEVNGKRVVLLNVGSAGAVIVEVDGVSKTIFSGGIEIINGLEVSSVETYYDPAQKESGATLKIVPVAVEQPSSDVVISLPNIAGVSIGSELTVPVTMNSDKDVTSYEIHFTYNTDKLRLREGGIIPGEVSMGSNSYFDYNTVEGTSENKKVLKLILFGFSGSNTRLENGEMFRLKFDVLLPPTNQDLTISEAIFLDPDINGLSYEIKRIPLSDDLVKVKPAICRFADKIPILKKLYNC